MLILSDDDDDDADGAGPDIDPGPEDDELPPKPSREHLRIATT